MSNLHPVNSLVTGTDFDLVYTISMLTSEQLKNKKVIIRADLDVPVKDGRVENDYRLEALLPTIGFCLENARHTLLIGHMGRPEGKDPSLSLAPVQEWLKSRLNRDIPFIPSGFSPGEWWTGDFPLSLLENLRFDPGEEKEDREFASRIATGADIYIYEAFSTYRPCASMRIIPELVPTYTGLRFDKEVTTLAKVLERPEHPTLLIVSGAKTDKLEIIDRLRPHFDRVLLGGKLAQPQFLTVDGLDLNDGAISLFSQEIAKAKMIVFNAPPGVYEDGIHAKGTKSLLLSLKDSSAFTILGGGDTLAAIPSLGFAYTDYGFVSTGGGAMLEYLATGTHPLLEVLKSLKK